MIVEAHGCAREYRIASFTYSTFVDGNELVQRQTAPASNFLRSAIPSSLYRSAFAPPLLIGIAFFYLAYASHAPPVSVWSLFLPLAAAWLGFAWFAALSPGRVALVAGILCAVAVRIAGIWSLPIHEDDWARYLWDGIRFLQDGTPYKYAPAAYFDFDLGPPWDSVLAQVNNPSVPTIYAPTLQYVFALATWIGPASLTTLKAILVTFDVLLWGVIARLGGAVAGLRYALCPLVIFEVAFNAHADIVGVALIMVCYALALSGRWVHAGLAIGLAIASKPFALIVAPTLLRGRWIVTGVAALAALIALYAPFVLSGATELEGLQVFSRWWEFNSFGFVGLKALLGDPTARTASFIVGSGLAAALALRWRFAEPNTVPPADIWLLALLVFAPVINPWYLLWALPWACLRPNALTWAVLPAISLSYLTTGVLGLEADSFHDHPVWVRPLEVAVGGAIYAVLTHVMRHREAVGAD